MAESYAPRPALTAAHPFPETRDPPPQYPPAAIAHGEQGSVLLLIQVRPDGAAGAVEVTQGTGYHILDQAARQAALHWRFAPALADGKPVAQAIPFRINFDLASGQALVQ